MKISVDMLRFLRRNANLTIREFAVQAGVSPTYVSLIEHGHRPLTPKLQKRFLTVFGLPQNDNKEAI